MISRIAIIIGVLLFIFNIYSVTDFYLTIHKMPKNQCGMIYLGYAIIQVLNLVICLPLLIALMIWFKRQPVYLVKPAIVLLILDPILVLAGWLIIN